MSSKIFKIYKNYTGELEDGTKYKVTDLVYDKLKLAIMGKVEIDENINYFEIPFNKGDFIITKSCTDKLWYKFLKAVDDFYNKNIDEKIKVDFNKEERKININKTLKFI
jgi:hypothetical protein